MGTVKSGQQFQEPRKYRRVRGIITAGVIVLEMGLIFVAVRLLLSDSTSFIIVLVAILVLLLIGAQDILMPRLDRRKRKEP